MTSNLADPVALSPEHLTRILRDGDVLPEGCRVARSTVEPMDGGYLSRTTRIRLEYESEAPSAPDVLSALSAPSAPASLIAKSPADDPLARAVATALGMYTREVHFYRDLAPRVAMRTPRCWDSSLAPESGDFSLLIEDLSDATMHDQHDGCPPGDALLAVRELARLHGSTWNDPALAELEWLNRLNPATAEMWQQMFGTAWHAFLSHDEVDLPPDLLAVGTALADSDFVTWSCGHSGPLALAHADYHLSNLLFRDVPESTGSRREVVTVDWQMAMHAPPLVDVAYFAGRMPTGTRRSIERELVAAYHKGLVEAGVRRYPLDRCWTDYQRWTWFGVFSAVAASAAYSMSAEQVRRYTSKVVRYLTQARDHDAIRFLDGAR